jgi:hypothetical protein
MRQEHEVATVKVGPLPVRRREVELQQTRLHVQQHESEMSQPCSQSEMSPARMHRGFNERLKMPPRIISTHERR